MFEQESVTYATIVAGVGIAVVFAFLVFLSGVMVLLERYAGGAVEEQNDAGGGGDRVGSIQQVGGTPTSEAPNGGTSEIEERTATDPASKTSAPVKAPMSGVVKTIEVRVGDRVERDQIVARLEAMKMEISVTSDRQGTITHISTAGGESVSENDPLLFVG